MASVENQLIDSLPRKDRVRLLSRCEPVPLVLSEVLCAPGVASRYVYFPIAGFISLLALMDGKPAVEVGMVGREGMLGAQFTLGLAAAPLHGLVQCQGTAWRIGAGAFRSALSQSPVLQRCLLRYNLHSYGAVGGHRRLPAFPSDRTASRPALAHEP